MSSDRFNARGFPGNSDGKESACNVGAPGLIPGLGRSPGEGNGNPFQYSCLENSTDRAALQATVHGVTESDMTEGLSLHSLMTERWMPGHQHKDYSSCPRTSLLHKPPR